jgi:threonine/homoserine/homoserine lactone efflux protein
LARTAPAPGDGDALRRPRIRRALDAVMGATLVALGVRVAAER